MMLNLRMFHKIRTHTEKGRLLYQLHTLNALLLSVDIDDLWA